MTDPFDPVTYLDHDDPLESAFQALEQSVNERRSKQARRRESISALFPREWDDTITGTAWRFEVTYFGPSKSILFVVQDTPIADLTEVNEVGQSFRVCRLGWQRENAKQVLIGDERCRRLDGYGDDVMLLLRALVHELRDGTMMGERRVTALRNALGMSHIVENTRVPLRASQG